MNINKLCLQTHKNTGEFHCVSFDTWREYTCECGKAAHGSLLHSIITGEIYSLSSYYIVCVCVCFGAKFQNGNGATEMCASLKMELNGADGFR